MKQISILGSTGSIGMNTLNVVKCFPEKFGISGLAAGTNIALLKDQINTFKPRIVSVHTDALAQKLDKVLPTREKPEIVYGEEGLKTVASDNDADMVVSAIVGSAGLVPTLTAIKKGKHIALANKETLVMAGKIVMREARKRKVNILPVDSEHSAVFQALQGHKKDHLKSIVLTASGGPFLRCSHKKLAMVTPEEALKHPNWKMGKRVTIDSASLMNKGLEVIEAKWLFDVSLDEIKVYIHPQSIVHAMVEYIDGSVIAQLSPPDMKHPIAYALSYPERINTDLSPLDLLDIGSLSFSSPDFRKFPALGLAYRALEEGETMPAVLNAADEIAVSAFLNRRISFTEIPVVIEKTMCLHQPQKISSIEDVLHADRWSRTTTEATISQLN